MVIDTSAIMAILLQEKDAELYARAIQRAPVRLISTATLVEAGIVSICLAGDRGEADLDDFLGRFKVDVTPLSEEHARLAREAFRRFGKGRHKAGLNYGDCFSYALAIANMMPLLCKGDDFPHTDVKLCALPAT